MRILKFEGATIRDAIAKVKAELGDQAVVISSRQVRRGLLGTAIEISAAVDDDGPAFAQGPARRAPTSAPEPAEEPGRDLHKLIDPLRSELKSLRALVRTAGDPRGSAELRSEVAALRRLVEQLRAPAPAAAPPATTTPLAEEAPLVAPSTARAVMLVGPTGAGKTTTIAKLAARAALIEHRRVKLVTLDNFRVGGVDQIRTFADLIGVPLDVLESPHELADVLDDGHDLTLIDTAGRSPRDTGPTAELAAALRDARPLEVHLVAPAALSPAGLEALAARYRELAPARLLVTKLDEVDACPELVRMPARVGLPITWVTTGQAVPEDLEEPTAARLRELAAARFTPNHRAA